ncbi:MAG: hypothetical protein RLZZ522_522 [Verrucomicrobiota bacterium]|jgi:hypothetical protein
MTPAPTHFPAKAGGILGFLAMAAIGWNLADGSGPAPSAAEVAPPAGKRSERPARPVRSTGPASIAGKRLDAIRRAASPDARMRATLDLANSLPPSEFAAWLDGGFFTLRDGAELTLFTKIIQERWLLEDPEGLILWSIKNESSQGRNLLATWAEKEPQRAIDFFKNHPDDNAEMQALASIANSHPALALRRLQEMAGAGISVKGAGNALSLLRRLAEKSPADLEILMDSLPSQMRSQAEAALSGPQLKASFATEIRVLWDRPDGWKIFQTNMSGDQELCGKLFDELANLPPAWRASVASNYYYFIDEKNAAKWLDADLAGYGYSSGQVKNFRDHALQTLAQNQPDEVIKRMRDMDLDAETRRNIISQLLSSVSNDPEKAEALIARLGSEEDRKLARSTQEASLTQEVDPKLTQPADWLEKMGSVDPKAVSDAYQYFSMLWQWDSDKVAALTTQFKSMPDDKKQSIALAIAAARNHGYDGSPALSGEAIRYLVAHPPASTTAENTSANADPFGQASSNTDPLRMASEYAGRLAVKDPVAASDWVQTLPAGDSKLWAQKNLARNWAIYDPKAAGQWVQSLPPDARTEVQNFMKKKE